MNLNGKKMLLIGFVVVLLVGIPLTVYLLQQQQEVRTRAEASTIVTFTPDSTSAAPIKKNVGEEIPLDINVDPGKNLVSFVKLEINYDPDILATGSANAFQANTTAFPSVLEGPVYTPGKIAVTLSVGPDPTKAIQQKVKAATITFTALKNTPPGTPTLVSYSSNTQVLSIGSNDQASENVLSTATPATIEVGGAVAPTDQPIPSGTIAPTVPLPTDQPLPTDAPLPTETPIATPTTGPIGSGTPNEPPTCSSLVVDRASSGPAPFSITFTANGSDTNDNISKVTFNFGDGQQSEVTTGGGIGTPSVNTQASFTYNNPGTYQATAILTDGSNGVSLPNDNCKQLITVTEASGSAQQPNTGGGNVTLTPTMVPTGVTETAMGIGAAVMMLIVGGALLFFVL